MFKKWLAIFKKDTLMDRAYKRSFQMLDITLEMFQKARHSLRHKDHNVVDIDIDIYDRDVEINRFEREVRRNVFNHLVMSGTEELSSGLILVSIIIDIERIGDYTKNIVELAINHPSKLQSGNFEQDLKKIEAAVEDTFKRTIKCFKAGDSDVGMELLQEYGWVNRLCDNRMMDLVKEEDKSISHGEAVSLALYFRWLKRINSHLRNITTSVVNPFDRIGFRPKDQKKS